MKNGRYPPYSVPGDPAPDWVGRLREAIAMSGRSMRELSRGLGEGEGEGIVGAWGSGVIRNPSFKKMIDVCVQMPEVNTYWIMTGVGSLDDPNPTPLPEELTRLIEAGPNLSATVRRAVTTFFVRHRAEVSVEDWETIVREFEVADGRARNAIEVANKRRKVRAFEGRASAYPQYEGSVAPPVVPGTTGETTNSKPPLARTKKAPAGT